MNDEQIPLLDVPFSFGPKFLQDHAGHIMTDPRIALVELVANSYDGGASLVKLFWPDAAGETFEISDNGTGMTANEFRKRWKTFSYNRPEEQGIYVEYPPDKKGPAKREAFGQNGKGRFAPFCFADAYEIETWKDGTSSLMRVTLTHGGIEPFHCELISESKKVGQWGQVYFVDMDSGGGREVWLYSERSCNPANTRSSFYLCEQDWAGKERDANKIDLPPTSVHAIPFRAEK